MRSIYKYIYIYIYIYIYDISSLRVKTHIAAQRSNGQCFHILLLYRIYRKSISHQTIFLLLVLRYCSVHWRVQLWIFSCKYDVLRLLSATIKPFVNTMNIRSTANICVSTVNSNRWAGELPLLFSDIQIASL